MKYYRIFLFSSVVALTVLPASLSAIAPDDLAQKIITARANLAAQADAPAVEEDFLTTARKVGGDILRCSGDYIRTDGGRSIVGQLKDAIFNTLCSAAADKTGIAKTTFTKFKDTICVASGNGLRTLGQWIKGGKPTQTPTRVLLDNMGLNKNSNDADIEKALGLAAKAALIADKKFALEDYKKVAEGLVKRGYGTKEQIQAVDENGIYIKAFAEEALRQNNALTLPEFIKAVNTSCFDVLESVTTIKSAAFGNKTQVMGKWLKEAYDVARIRQGLEVQPF